MKGFICKQRKHLKIGCIYLFFLSLFFPTAFAAEIQVGMTSAFTGPAQSLGILMSQGIQAYFNKVNDAGGIQGNTLKLVTMDDQYEPYLAAKNMRKLSADQSIIAIVGNAGTPTAVETVPIANDEKILLFGALSGAEILRKTPPDRYVINYRASYAQETGAIVRALLEAGIKPEEMAFFTQADSYGDSGYVGAISALEEYASVSPNDVKKIPHGLYPHNTIDIQDGLNTIINSNKKIKAFIIVGAYKPAAEFIKRAKEYYPDAFYMNVSFVGTEALLKELCKLNKMLCAEHTKRVMITQVVPDFNSELPIAKEYREALHKYMPNAKPTFVSFEGYILAKILVLGVQKSGNDLNRESIINALESLGGFDIGLGYPLFLSKTKHQASDNIWPTMLDENKNIRVIKWKDIKP